MTTHTLVRTYVQMMKLVESSPLHPSSHILLLFHFHHSSSTSSSHFPSHPTSPLILPAIGTNIAPRPPVPIPPAGGPSRLKKHRNLPQLTRYQQAVANRCVCRGRVRMSVCVCVGVGVCEYGCLVCSSDFSYFLSILIFFHGLYLLSCQSSKQDFFSLLLSTGEVRSLYKSVKYFHGLNFTSRNSKF